MHTEIPGQASIELPAYYEQFAHYYPQCEMSTKRWCVDHIQPDWTIFDVGANLGYYSILFSRLAPQGTVYAFEPTSTFTMLERNLKHHQTTNVQPLNLAVGDKNGTVTDNIFRLWGSDPERMPYPFTTLDSFVNVRAITRVDLIKIDVDGFDLEVLRGAVGVLHGQNPFVLVEMNHALVTRGQSLSQAMEWLIAQGYSQAVCFEGENYLLRRNTDLGFGHIDSMTIRYSHSGVAHA